jgi:hypothetical protein
MGRIALSISHESEFAVAIAYGVRTEGGRFLFPPDIEERLAEREAVLLRRLERLRDLARETAEVESGLSAEESPARSARMAETGRVQRAPGKEAGND